MNILQALTDPKLLGNVFAGDTWRAWRALLAGAFCLPMDDPSVETFRRLTGRAPPRSPIQELWALAGRRSGKSTTAAALLIYLATLRRWKLSPGETGVALLLAADRDQAKVAFKYVRGLLEASPILVREIDSTTADEIRLRNGIEIAIGTADRASVRGRTLICAICDEVAFWGADAEEVLQAIRPAMASQPEALLICISTAYAQRGPLFDAFRRSYGVDDPRVLVVRAATRELNEQITQQFIDEQLQRDPVAARAEYLSEFRTDSSAFLDGALIDTACQAARLERGRRHSALAFCDLSGGAHDAAALAICHAESVGRSGQLSLFLDHLQYVEAPHEPARVVADFARALKNFGLRRVTGDRYGAGWPVGAFEKQGIRYVPSELSASEIYLECAPVFAERRVQLIPDKRLIGELRQLERKPRTGGRGDLVDHPAYAGAHDDVAVAVCGSLWLAASRREWHIPEPGDGGPQADPGPWGGFGASTEAPAPAPPAEPELVMHDSQPKPGEDPYENSRRPSGCMTLEQALDLFENGCDGPWRGFRD